MECKLCDRKLTRFMHNCPNTSNYVEIEGCPFCDDKCGFCIEEK